MSSAPLPPGHAAFAMLRLGRLVAAELVGEALDPDADLTKADRLALAALALAVDIEVSRRAGVELMANAREKLADALAGVMP